LGIVDWTRGRRQDALRHFTEAARMAPANYVAHLWAGLIEDDGAERKADVARREQALGSFRRLLAVDRLSSGLQC